uniref:Uncharacterized protein n=1 Tax=Anopheles quadriannulatus TaxID=34691 RepID=A0A182XRD3_ANOQN
MGRNGQPKGELISISSNCYKSHSSTQNNVNISSESYITFDRQFRFQRTQSRPDNTRYKLS